MKTPIKLPDREFKALSSIKKLFPEESYIHSFLLYNAGLEIPLSADGRYVIAHTNRYSIYEFWTCLNLNAEQVQRVVQHFDNIQDKNIFHLLQENLPTYPDPYLRAGMFFLLNKYSKSGYVSRGEFEPDSHNPLALANLRRVSFDNFMVMYNKEQDLVENMKNIKNRCDYVFVPVGDFSLNYLKNKEEGFNSLAYDQTFVDTKALKEFIAQTDKKTAYLYHYNKSVDKFFDGQEKYLIDQWGRPTNDKSRAKEIIVANF